MYKEVQGNLITMALEGQFEVITHGCNCMCAMGAGIAPQMAAEFGCDHFDLEQKEFIGDMHKLGDIDYELVNIEERVTPLYVVNSYTQYAPGWNPIHKKRIPLDYSALRLCMMKINHIFKGKAIGLPQIGAGLAGGNWNYIKRIIRSELKDMDVTVVIFNGK